MSKERAAQLVDAGIWLRLSGDIEGARRLFERALKLDPENQRAQDLLEQAPSTVVEPTSSLSPSPVPAVPALGAPGVIGEPDWGERPTTVSPSGIGEDWGRMTGRSSPPPQAGGPPPAPLAAGLGEVPPAATGVMFAPGRGSPPPRPSSPPPISPSTPAPPSIAPVSPVPGTGALRSTIPYAGTNSPPPLVNPGQRHTMMFTTDPGTGGLPGRQTLPFGGPEPAPSTPRSPPPQTLVPAPLARTTLPYSAPSPAPRVTFPPLESTDSELGGPPRATQVFSSATAGPLAPSEMPDVRPMVIRIDAEEEASGPDELVEALRAQVDAGANRGPRPTSIVLTGTAPEPSPPSATPPLFPEPPPQPAGPAASPGAARAQAGVEAAWNWSASPPPGTRGLPSDEGMPTPRPSPGLAPQASSGWDQRGTPGIKIDDMVGPDNALEFVSTGSNLTRSPEADREEVETLLRGARDLIDLDDHTGAMELISRAQALAPDDPQVQQLKERSERTLLAMFESKLGHLDKIPRVMLKDDEIIWLNLDHRAGFVLAQIDGTVSFEDLFAVSGMSRLDTARILAQLVDEGVISRG